MRLYNTVITGENGKGGDQKWEQANEESPNEEKGKSVGKESVIGH